MAADLAVADWAAATATGLGAVADWAMVKVAAAVKAVGAVDEAVG